MATITANTGDGDSHNPNAVICRRGEQEKQGQKSSIKADTESDKKSASQKHGPGQLLLQGRRLPAGQPGTADSGQGQ